MFHDNGPILNSAQNSFADGGHFENSEQLCPLTLFLSHPCSADDFNSCFVFIVGCSFSR